MAQYEMDLRDYWRIVRRRRLVIVTSTVLVALCSFWFSRQRTPVYQATASVRFEQSTSMAGLLVEVLSFSGGDTVETQTTIIRSYPVLEQVAERLGKLPAGAGTAAMRESRAYGAVLDGLVDRVRAARVGSTNIIEITATAGNPREARELANTVAEVYRGYTSRLRNARIIEARQFIEQQLREVEARVKRTEEEMWAFREANRVISPGAESAVLLSLFTQLRGDIEHAREQRTELELAQSRLGRGLPAGRHGERVFIESANPAVTRLQGSLVELELERNTLALELTDRHPRIQVLDDRMREVEQELRRELGAQIAQLRAREEILGRQIGELFQKNRELPAVELALQRMQREAKVNDDLLALLKTKHQEALIKEAERVDEVTIVRPASEPTTAAGRDATGTVLAGGLIGLILGLVLAFIQETLDTSIGTIEDVETYLGVPVLGVIPHIDARETIERLLERRPDLAKVERETLQRHALLITHFDPKSPVAEAYRTLRTNIQFARMDRPGKVFLVTSPTLQEGKTTTIVNLALTMAQSGQKTLLVGSNLRRPSIYRFFGIDREPGLSDVLVGNARWQDCIRTVADLLMGRFEMEDLLAAPGLDNLNIIESGPIPANPSELLSTSAMGTFLAAVREHYDIVLIDAPPVLPVTDSAIIGGQTDGVILVYQAGKVGRLVLKRAKVQLESARGRVWGVVLNDIQAEITGYATYSHHYTHYYGEEATPGAPRAPRSWTERLLASVAARLGVGPKEDRPPDPLAPPTVAEAVVPSGAGLGGWRVRLGLLLLAALVLAAITFWWWTSRVGPRTTVIDDLRLRAAGRTVAPPPEAPAASPPPAAAPNASSPAPGSVPPADPAPARASEPEPGAAGPVESPSPSAAVVSRAAPSVPAGPAPEAAAFSLEFGPFLGRSDADEVERRLNQAGYQTARYRQRLGASVFAVFIENVPSAREADALVAALQQEGFPGAVVTGTREPFSVRIGDPAPLRLAVALAERVRAKGHVVRVAAQAGDAVQYVIRHGSFPDREAALRQSRDLAALGLANQVVQVK
jgi:polysaccharide biosynthesis transport protein